MPGAVAWPARRCSELFASPQLATGIAALGSPWPTGSRSRVTRCTGRSARYSVVGGADSHSERAAVGTGPPGDPGLRSPSPGEPAQTAWTGILPLRHVVREPAQVARGRPPGRLGQRTHDLLGAQLAAPRGELLGRVLEAV